MAALKKRMIPVEYLRYEDEGHGLAKLKNRLDAYPKMVAFLDRYLRIQRCGKGGGCAAAQPPRRRLTVPPSTDDVEEGVKKQSGRLEVTKGNCASSPG